MKIVGLVSIALLASVTSMLAADTTITSFHQNGELTFTEQADACSYRIEWASSPSGPWSSDWNGLDKITASGSGEITKAVPMFYRTVTTPIPEGMVRILGGTKAGTNPLEAGEVYNIEIYPESYIYYKMKTFYMDETEVTKELWDEVYDWAQTNGYTIANAGAAEGAGYPVHSITLYDAIIWCNARSEMDGRSPCYMSTNVCGEVYRGVSFETPTCDFSANGYRLPVSMEWEYAARGDSASTRYPWGNTITHDEANYWSSDSYSYDLSPTRGYHPTYAATSSHTCPVKKFATNSYQLYGMIGNVEEWTWSLTAVSGGTKAIVKGSGAGASAYDGRIGCNKYRFPAQTQLYRGFRTVFR